MYVCMYISNNSLYNSFIIKQVLLLKDFCFSFTHMFKSL